MQRLLGRLPLGQHFLQSARGHFGLRQQIGQGRHAQARCGQAHDQADVVARHPAAHGHQRLLRAPVQRPAARFGSGGGLKQQAFVLRQLLRRARLPVRGQVVRRGIQPAAKARQQAGHQGGIGQLAHAQGHVKALAGQIDPISVFWFFKKMIFENPDFPLFKNNRKKSS